MWCLELTHGINHHWYFLLIELSSLKKFDEIKKANQAAAKKLVEDQLSSSSEDDDEDAEAKQGKILDKTFTIYTSQTGNGFWFIDFYFGMKA